MQLDIVALAGGPFLFQSPHFLSQRFACRPLQANRLAALDTSFAY
jgi:hypothetical protein